MIANKQGLDKSVNRSLGRQFKNGIKDLPQGSIIRNFTMKKNLRNEMFICLIIFVDLSD